MRGKQNNFGTKYSKGEIITDKPNGKTTRKKFEKPKEGPAAKLHLDSLRLTLKKDTKLEKFRP